MTLGMWALSWPGRTSDPGNHHPNTPRRCWAWWDATASACSCCGRCAARPAPSRAAPGSCAGCQCRSLPVPAPLAADPSTDRCPCPRTTWRHFPARTPLNRPAPQPPLLPLSVAPHPPLPLSQLSSVLPTPRMFTLSSPAAPDPPLLPQAVELSKLMGFPNARTLEVARCVGTSRQLSREACAARDNRVGREGSISHPSIRRKAWRWTRIAI